MFRKIRSPLIAVCILSVAAASLAALHGMEKLGAFTGFQELDRDPELEISGLALMPFRIALRQVQPYVPAGTLRN